MNQAYTFYLRIYIYNYIYTNTMGPPNLHIFRGFYGKSPGFLGMAKTMTILSTIHGVEPHLSKAGWVDQGTRQVGVAGAPRHRWGTVGTETELGIWWPTWLWQWKHSNEKWTCWRCISYWTWRYSSTILLMVQKSGVHQLRFCSLSTRFYWFLYIPGNCLGFLPSTV